MNAREAKEYLNKILWLYSTLQVVIRCIVSVRSSFAKLLSFVLVLFLSPENLLTNNLIRRKDELVQALQEISVEDRHQQLENAINDLKVTTSLNIHRQSCRSMPLTYGSGSVISFSSLTFKTPTKNLFLFIKFLCLLLFEGTFTSFFKDKKSKRSHKTEGGIKVFFIIFA
jgi:hypothetical protein